MRFPLSRDCMQKVSSLVRRTALSRVMICTGALILSIAQKQSPPKKTTQIEKQCTPNLTAWIFRGASPYCPVQPSPV